MTTCTICGSYFKKSIGHRIDAICPDCDGFTDNYDILDDEVSLDIDVLMNPSGRVKPHIHDESSDYYSGD